MRRRAIGSAEPRPQVAKLAAELLEKASGLVDLPVAKRTITDFGGLRIEWPRANRVVVLHIAGFMPPYIFWADGANSGTLEASGEELAKCLKQLIVQ